MFKPIYIKRASEYTQNESLNMIERDRNIFLIQQSEKNKKNY
jgi:hypothetical protein